MANVAARRCARASECCKYLRTARRDTRRRGPPRSAQAAAVRGAAPRRRRCRCGPCLGDDRWRVRESVEVRPCVGRARMFEGGTHSSVFAAAAAAAGKTTVLVLVMIPRAIASFRVCGHAHVGMHGDEGVRPWMVRGSTLDAGMRGNVMMACDGAVAAEVARVPASRMDRRAGVWWRRRGQGRERPGSGRVSTLALA